MNERPSAGRVHILEDRSLKIDNITMDDIGEYSCEADNAVGTIVASGMLLVHGEFDFHQLWQLFVQFPIDFHQQHRQHSLFDPNRKSLSSDRK